MSFATCKKLATKNRKERPRVGQQREKERAAISSPCGTMNIIKTTAGCISRAVVYMLNIPPGGAFDLTVTIVYFENIVIWKCHGKLYEVYSKHI